jgi:putative selenium metabolism hydrolase
MSDLLTSLSLCQALVRAPSLSGDEQRAAEIVAGAMRRLGYDEVTTDDYGSVIGIQHGQVPGRTLLFDAHLDTVPPTSHAEWQHGPFSGEVVSHRLWGRGACDDKGVLAAIICGAARVPREAFAGKIIVSASVCEENLTGAALAFILDHYPADLVIVGEPTNLKLGMAQKGRAGIRVFTRGTSAHTSRPELGENAIYKMIEAIAHLRAIALPTDPELGPSFLELTEIVSEPLPSLGFVPFGCRARFVARTMPGETQESILARFQNALTGLDGITVEFDQLTQRCYTGKLLTMRDFIPGWRMSTNNPWRSIIQNALGKNGLGVETFAAPYGTNASISAGVRGIPTFIFGPGSIEQAHMVDEWIAIDDLEAGERAYATIAQTCLAR